MEVTNLIERITSRGIYTSAKEPAEVSQAVILEGLRFLQLDDADRIIRESMNGARCRFSIAAN